MQVIHFTQAAADPLGFSGTRQNRMASPARPHVGALRLLGMQIFRTLGATDPLKGFGAMGASFLPLADGQGDTHVSCAHLEAGATINAPSLTHAAALLVVHGRMTITSEHGEPRNTDIHSGMGIVVARGEPYSFKSDSGAILLIVESQELTAHARAISTPQRIEGATWPSDSVIA
jgi:mannose-6-phosphate isomerase-like protein (cupin superfamily)